ncbi:GTP 3',8-cyclase MoaA [Pikeienuella piscinae]|uniref:GTP 3',8-cyclase n=1 Tax=Pikeienuella piscinae TaxID=2748098 RepID=A0A7L5BX57_9RHOB|nr:GTP 3',8-cyclase MoaA [Pikeienuella piscinae]QIE56312.1 GTP 3',8-cyclase MoaA [Pikeienuella piscinae]
MDDAPKITPAGATSPMIDPFGRPITYLRVSVTDRCDFRCVYCMSESMTFLPKKELLTLEELERVCGTFIDMGVRKLRITGGEPLVRRDIMKFFAAMGKRIGDHPGGGLDELTLTTNGSQLRRFATQLAECGVKRVNISMDTLDKKKFAEITRWGRFDQVMDGIDAAQEAGLSVKINAVALKGVNDDEIHDMVEWCGQRGFDITFIEVMPMGDIGNENRLDQYYSLRQLREDLGTRWRLTPLPLSTGGPARYMRCEETGGRIGFITPLSHNFCEGCNRVRLTCTGQLFMCLGQDDDADLRSPMRVSPEDDAPLRKTIESAIARKPKGHDFDYSRQRVDGEVGRHMSTTGG